jgi:endonuclease I
MKKITYLFFLMPLYCLGQIPAYYSALDFTQSGEGLKNQLASLITNTHTFELVYTPDVWNALKQTDLDPANPGKVLLIYGFNDTDAITRNDRTRSKESSCHTSGCNGLWVREHVYARNLGDPNLGDEGPGSDAHHLRAIDSQMNGSRSDRPFTDGSGTASTVGTALFYPGDEWKGDVARMMMYMYLRYQSQCEPVDVGSGSTSYSPLGDMPNIFLEWNQEDPVSQYEINRNTILQTLQGNRNPFIDNPYLATLIWNGPAATDAWGVLAADDVASVSNVVVYPTMTSGYVYVENTGNRTYSYTAFNNLGQQVNVTISNNRIDFSSNASGMYFLNLQDGSEVKTVRIIKQ